MALFSYMGLNGKQSVGETEDVDIVLREIEDLR